MLARHGTPSSTLSSKTENSLQIRQLHNSNNNIFSPARLIFRNTVTREEHLANTDQEQFFLLNMFKNYDNQNDCIPFVAEGFDLVPKTDGMAGVLKLQAYHCDGIVCLVQSQNFILCNLAIKEVHFLPPADLPR